MSDLSTELSEVLDKYKVDPSHGGKLIGDLMGVAIAYEQRLHGLHRALIADLIDDEHCRTDHHGYCQTHTWFETEPECPHKRAKMMGIMPS